MAKYVARHTKLHPRLWYPYTIVAYPYGFHDWPEGLADPVWTPRAHVVADGCARIRDLGDCATLDDALAACWEHFVTLRAA